MEVTAVIERVRGVAAVRANSSADRAALEGGLRSITVVRSWLASAEADLSSRLAGVASFPEQAIAEAGRGTQNDASRVLERSSTLGSVPALADALDDGSVTPAHVDAVTKVAKGLDGAARGKLLEHADRLVSIARHGSVSDFRKRLEREAESLRADDGTERFERQKKGARLRNWTDADGMWCLFGRFDPMTGVRLNARLQAEIEAAFAESVPEGCPTDPQAKSDVSGANRTTGGPTEHPQCLLPAEFEPQPWCGRSSVGGSGWSARQTTAARPFPCASWFRASRSARRLLAAGRDSTQVACILWSLITA